MAEPVAIPVVEATPQDAHDETVPVALDDVAGWSKKAHKQGVGAGVTVGVVDTRFQSLGWFSGSSVQGDHQGNVPGLLDTNFKAGHSTFIAGLVLQQAPAAQVEVKGVLDWQGTGTIDAVADAAVDLVQGGVDVLNLSLGSYGTAAVEGDRFQQLLTQLQTLNPGIVVVAAAGNRRAGENRSFYPAVLADHDHLVSVAAGTDESAGTIAEWSNRGDYVTFVVNGSRIVSTFLKFGPNGRPRHWVQWAGTSFAAASASGLIAATMAPATGGGLSARAAVAQLRGGGGGPQVPLVARTFPPVFPEP